MRIKSFSYAVIIFSCVSGCHSNPQSTLPPALARPYTIAEIEAQKEVGICKLHGERLQPGQAFVTIGTPQPSYLDAQFSRFPHSELLVMSERRKDQPYAEVLYCAKCRAAESTWQRSSSGESP